MYLHHIFLEVKLKILLFNDFIQCLGNLLAYPTICVGTKHDDKMNGVFASETIW